MPKFTKKVNKKRIGLSPGSLLHVEERDEPIVIEAYDYNEQTIEKRVIGSLDELKIFADTQDKISWIDISGVHDTKVVKEIGSIFNIHELFLEDIINLHQRPKLDEGEHYLYVVLHMLDYHQTNEETLSEQVSMIIGKKFLLTFQQRPGDVFNPVRERLVSGKGKIRKMNADYLAYALIDVIVDKYFLLLEQLGDRIETMEDKVLEDLSIQTYRDITALKRELIFIRKNVWPLREVLNNLMHPDVPVITKHTRIFFKDVYDHTIQVMDNVETYRDILANVLDLYMSSVSNRMNEVMKTLTIIATIFIPLTFLAGVYGMNFRYMPELEWKFAYPALWAIMLIVTGGLLIYFRRKNGFE